MALLAGVNTCGVAVSADAPVLSSGAEGESARQMNKRPKKQVSRGARMGPLPSPSLRLAHDVRHLVVCAFARCRHLGDEREMVATRATEFQSMSSGEACYHGRCFVQKFGLGTLLALPRRQLAKLTLGDVGAHTMRAIARKRARA